MTEIFYADDGRIETFQSTDIDGVQFWKNEKGKTHRIGGPAVIRPNGGGEEWWQDGKLHREDGPAFIHRTGAEIWYYKGKVHRENGPALTFPDGEWRWYYKNKIHREDGPAEYQPRLQQHFWWWRGLSYSSFLLWLDKIKEQNFEKYVLTKMALYDTYKDQ